MSDKSFLHFKPPVTVVTGCHVKITRIFFICAPLNMQHLCIDEGALHTQTRIKSHNLTFRPSRAPESRGTLPSFMRLLSKIRPIRRSPSLDGCHVTGCYKVRATTHLLFNNSSTRASDKSRQESTVKWGKGGTISHSRKKVHTNSVRFVVSSL